MKQAPGLAHHRDGAVAEVRQQAGEVGGGRVAGGDGYLDFCARLCLGVALRPLVGDEIAVADAAQAQRLVGDGEIAVRGVEVVVSVGARRVLAGAPVAQPPLDGGEVGAGVFHFDFEDVVSPPRGTVC